MKKKQKWKTHLRLTGRKNLIIDLLVVACALEKYSYTPVCIEHTLSTGASAGDAS
jgi:hypothetical protein